jgi:hypothetical protein
MKTYLMITVSLTGCWIAALSPTTALRADQPSAASTAVPVPPIKSAHAHGTVVLAPDPSLTGGRLVMRLVAYNGNSEPSELTPAAIHISTPAGETVPLVPLDQLLREASEVKRSKATRGPTTSDVMPGSFSQDSGSAMRDSTGSLVHGVNGGVNTAGADRVPYAAPAGDAVDSKESQAKRKEQLAALKAGILQTLSIAPHTAAGAQIVTDKLKFAANEERVLHVKVDFNGEQHELRVPVPPES